MTTGSFDAAVQAAMQSYLAACDALDAATDDAAVLALSDAKALAGLNLRKCLVESGWKAPTGQRSTM